MEGGALARNRFGPGAAAVAGNNTTHRREPDTRAGELRCLVQALENAEQLVGVGHVEADAVILDVERELEWRRLAHADLYDGFLARGRVFHRVVEEVLPDEPDHVL